MPQTRQQVTKAETIQHVRIATAPLPAYVFCKGDKTKMWIHQVTFKRNEPNACGSFPKLAAPETKDDFCKQVRTSPVRRIPLLCATLFFVLCAGLVAATAPEVPVIDGGLGSCRADFTVKDGSGKPIYNAKISVTLKRGFRGLHKTDLEIGTNSDGKARVTGLPNLPKKPLEFSIKSGTVSTTVTDDPSTDCNAVFDVTLAVR